MLGTSTRAVVFAAVMAAFAGCGGSKGGGNDTDGGNGGPLDGFIQTGCSTASDCVADACNVSKCNAATHMCEVTPKSCTSMNGCTISANTCVAAMCDASSGSAVWNQVTMNEGMTCTSDQGAAGTCVSGTCTPVPSCENTESAYYAPKCAPDNGSQMVASTDPTSFYYTPTQVTSSYTCAPNEAGPEYSVAFQLDSTVFTAPTSVTVTLQLADADAYPTVVFADQTTVDLDLIVLEDSCTTTATCKNPASGGTFQGVTAGTSAERVTFMADPAKTYYFVVDSKDMNDVSGFLLTVESCGQCATTPQTQLDCNTSMPVSSNTMTGQKVLTNYTCGQAATTYAMAGNEVPFLLKDSSGVARNYTATLTGATAGTGLLVLNQSMNGDCGGTDCVGGATVATNNASTSVAWSGGEPNDSFNYTPLLQRFWVVVDTPGTADSAFGLAVDCSPYCTIDPNNTLYCQGGSFNFNTTLNDQTTAGGPTASTQWGPAGSPCGGLTGLTGPEHVFEFTPFDTGTNSYTFHLQSNDATKNLSLLALDAGTTGTCDPVAACANVTGTPKYTTDVANDKTADVTISAVHGRKYLLVVDGADASGAAFNLVVDKAGNGCQ